MGVMGYRFAVNPSYLCMQSVPRAQLRHRTIPCRILAHFLDRISD
jgi:hypothetical protein